MNLFRVAVCFSGQARTWKYTLPNIQKFLSSSIHPESGQSVQFDYFIHTWNVSHYRHDANTWDFDVEELTLNDQLEIKSSYNPKYMEVGNFDKFKETHGSYKTFDPMFYSFMKSIHFKRNYELENDIEYDMVIKIRFDMIYDPRDPFFLHKIEPMIAYSCIPVGKFISEFHYNNFDDVLYYSDSKTMDLIAHTYRITHQKRINSTDINNLDPSFYYGPGCLLYDTMIGMSIHPYCIRPTPWYVVRKTVVESGLDPISYSDWESLKKLCLDWYR